MKAIGYLTIMMLCLGFTDPAQHFDFSAQLHVQHTRQYRDAIKGQPDKRLIEIEPNKTGIRLDIRYATTHNFMHTRMYSQARAFVRTPVYQALLAVEAALKQQGLGLKIFDAYRPYAVTVKFYEMARDTNFVADPAKGSRHNRGCAVDLTLIDLKTGKELPMPTGFDSFTMMASAEYPDLRPQVVHNRELLKNIMEAHGFTVLPTEWWHFDYNGWQHFELLDVPFDRL